MFILFSVHACNSRKLIWSSFLIFRILYLYRSQANKYTQEELMLMKTQDIGYILQKLQSERKVPMNDFWYIKGYMIFPTWLWWWKLFATNHRHYFILLQKIEKLTAVLHSVDNHPSNRHIYYAEDRFDFLILVYHLFFLFLVSGC